MVFAVQRCPECIVKRLINCIMNIKTYLILFLIISITACDPNNKHEGNNHTLGASNKIVGEWFIGQTISEQGVITSCNACPTITFCDNGTATLTFADKMHNNIYNWSTKADTITLRCTSLNITNPYFYSLRYKMTYTEKKDFTELKLTTNSNFNYILRKGNTLNSSLKVK